MANETVPPPPPPTSAGPAPAKAPAQAIDPQSGGPLSRDGDGQVMAAPGVVAVQRSFFQNPFVQTVLPFVTSLTIHLSIILIGVVFFLGAKMVQKKILHQEEYIIPAASMINDGAPGGVPFQGL